MTEGRSCWWLSFVANQEVRRHPSVSQRIRDGKRQNTWRVFAGAFRLPVCMNSVLGVGARLSRARPVAEQPVVAFAEVAVNPLRQASNRPLLGRSIPSFASVCAPEGTAWQLVSSHLWRFIIRSMSIRPTSLPNPSLKRSANGRPPGPACRYGVHFLQPGPGVLPSSPA